MEQQDTRVKLCADGKYRWTYEVNLYKNPSVFIDLIKAMLLSFSLVYVFMLIVSFCKDNLDWEWFSSLSITFFWIIVFMFFLCLFGYLIWAAIIGGRYVALYEMDDKSIIHSQMEKQVKRMQVLMEIGFLAGLVSENPTLSGNSILAACSSTWQSDFASVRKVKPVRRLHLIKIREMLMRNRIYVEDPQDYEFVLNYILERCPRIKNKQQ